MGTKRTESLVYKINPDIAAREIKGQLLFLRPDDRRLYTTNQAGRFVWHQLVRHSSTAKIIALFQKEFCLSGTAAERDVRAFLGELEKKRIIRRTASR